MTKEPVFMRSRPTFAVIGAAVLLTSGALASMPFWAEPALMRTSVELLYLIALAQLWNLMAGYGGMASFGQHAFLGAGAYATVACALLAGINPFLAAVAGAVVSGLIAWPTSRLVFQLKGPYFAIGTWVVAEVLRLCVTNTRWLGGGTGLSLTRAMQSMDSWMREACTLWLGIVVGVGTVSGVYLLMRSRTGRALAALRDNETAAESVGISIVPTKLLIYVVSATGFGLVGGLISLTQLRITPDSAFSMNWTIVMVFIAVIGGVGTVEGPLVGALLYFLLRQTLSEYGNVYLAVLGLCAILTMLFMPTGIWGAFSRRFDVHIFPVQIRVRPSSLTDSSRTPAPADLPVRAKKLQLHH